MVTEVFIDAYCIRHPIIDALGLITLYADVPRSNQKTDSECQDPRSRRLGPTMQPYSFSILLVFYFPSPHARVALASKFQVGLSPIVCCSSTGPGTYKIALFVTTQEIRQATQIKVKGYE